jgi:SAM-dependent methyltransferase
VLTRLRARLAQRSFDYQWRALPDSEFLLGDNAFTAHVDGILSEHELCIDRSWFEGRRVLDAGCGQGRWTEGFVRLGCQVTALDASEAALAVVRARQGERVRTVCADVLHADRELAGEQFDLVFCWGVLHHTVSTRRGIAALARLLDRDGLMYLYLYGRGSVDRRRSASLAAQRFALNLLPLRLRHRAIARMVGPEHAHEAFDALSTALNDRFTLEEAAGFLREAGLTRVVQTQPHTELFLRADRGRSSADEHLLPLPKPPYWFERPLAENGALRAPAPVDGAAPA